jgi:putative ABC transport system permease protein
MFKLMWNRKRRSLLLIIEMLVSFLVLFAVTATLFGWGLLFLEPAGFDSNDIRVIRVLWENKVKGQTTDDVREAMRAVEREVLAFDEVTGLCWAYSNTPYSNSTWTTGIKWKGRDISFDYIAASDSYADVLRIPLREGTWYGPERDASAYPPAVINLKLKNELFGPEEEAVGQIVSEEGENPDSYLIVGVVDQFRYKGEFNKERPILFERLTLADTAASPPSRAMIRVKPGTGVLFEKTLTERLTRMVPGWSVHVENMSSLRDGYFRTRYSALMTPGILGGFLVFNVALGLFGVLWYSVNRRKPELGLRRAMGAATGQVGQQILGEALVMATFAIILGVVLAVQAAVFRVLGDSVSATAYLLAILCSAFLICLLVAICAWYPARLAGRIHPAEALHAE